MLVSFKNLCSGDYEDVMDSSEPRRSMHIFCDITSLFVYQTKHKVPIWVVAPDALKGLDPKIHFRDEADAIKMYDYLVKQMVENVSYMEIDVLEHGAI